MQSDRPGADVAPGRNRKENRLYHPHAWLRPAVGLQQPDVFAAGAGGPGSLVDVVGSQLAPQGLTAGGTVHHIAFRVPDQTTQAVWREELASRGHRVTEILDRSYFTSIYFREPGGVLYEIATDTPGFDVDEPLLELGRSLKLPPWLEPSREDIEARVAPLRVPESNNPTGLVA